VLAQNLYAGRGLSSKGMGEREEKRKGKD